MLLRVKGQDEESTQELLVDPRAAARSGWALKGCRECWRAAGKDVDFGETAQSPVR